MTPAVIAALSAAIVAIITAAGTAISHIQLRRQVNAAPAPPLPPVVTPRPPSAGS